MALKFKVDENKLMEIKKQIAEKAVLIEAEARGVDTSEMTQEQVNELLMTKDSFHDVLNTLSQESMAQLREETAELVSDYISFSDSGGSSEDFDSSLYGLGSVGGSYSGSYGSAGLSEEEVSEEEELESEMAEELGIESSVSSSASAVQPSEQFQSVMHYYSENEMGFEKVEFPTASLDGVKNIARKVFSNDDTFHRGQIVLMETEDGVMIFSKELEVNRDKLNNYGSYMGRVLFGGIKGGSEISEVKNYFSSQVNSVTQTRTPSSNLEKSVGNYHLRSNYAPAVKDNYFEVDVKLNVSK